MNNIGHVNLDQEQQLERKINAALNPVRRKYWAANIIISLAVAFVTYAILQPFMHILGILAIITAEWVALHYITLKIIDRGLHASVVSLRFRFESEDFLGAVEQKCASYYETEDPSHPKSSGSFTTADFSFDRLEDDCNREFYRKRSWFDRGRGS